MKNTTRKWIEDLMSEKLGIHKEIDNHLCKVLNHRELLYLYIEICNTTKRMMPYEEIRSVDLIDKWLMESPK